MGLILVEYYLVGGAVRDKYLGLKVKDKDWLVVGATPAILLAKGFQQVGKDFPVFLHPKTKEEYALARTEKKAGVGYTGFICDFSPHISLKDDLLRRDLTINALAEDENGVLYDFYGGKTDLDKRVLRHVSPAFCEDPLRILRVARFAARFASLDFTIAPETLSLMKEMTKAGELTTLTAERVWQETLKALDTDSALTYFTVLEQIEALPVLYPELAIYLQENPDFLVQCQEELNTKPMRIEDRELFHFALIFSVLSDDALQALCRHLKVPNHFKHFTLMYHRFHRLFTERHALNDKDIMTCFNQIDVWRKPTFFEKLKEFHEWKCQQKSTMDTLWQAYQMAKQIDVQQIIQAGFQKAEIRYELERQRREQITKILSKNVA